MTAKQTYPSRRGKPDTRYLRTDARTGEIVRLIPDADGIIAITSDAEQRLADDKELPVAKAATGSKED